MLIRNLLLVLLAVAASTAVTACGAFCAGTALEAPPGGAEGRLIAQVTTDADGAARHVVQGGKVALDACERP